ncbi:hypothetical protein Cpir12675_002648 [Ceratocystis pirilliformis]|uniref:Uncharacterized protein n=1 Tax=Ceratocystis pirilliformis TaxID=259994 RepID=A0ABR3Z9F5_9PEZI
MNDFLNEHPRETTILRVQTVSIVHLKSFQSSFQKFMNSVNQQYTVHRIYSPDTDRITTAPALGEIRGKILMLQDFKTSSPGRYGLPWSSDTVSIYSTKLAVSTLFLNLTWADVKSHLNEAPLTGSGMNKLIGEYLINNDGDCYGIIVMMDFPGQYLGQQIVKLNDKYLSLDIPGVSHDRADASVVGEVGSSSTVRDDEASSVDT